MCCPQPMLYNAACKLYTRRVNPPEIDAGTYCLMLSVAPVLNIVTTLDALVPTFSSAVAGISWPPLPVQQPHKLKSVDHNDVTRSRRHSQQYLQHLQQHASAFEHAQSACVLRPLRCQVWHRFCWDVTRLSLLDSQPTRGN